MTELRIDKHVEAARREVRVRAWSASRTEAAFRDLGLRRLSDQQRRQTSLRIGAIALAAATIVAVVVASGAGRPVAAPAASSASVSAAPFERLGLGDATEVRFPRSTRVDVREQTEARVVVGVQRGTAHFSVRHDPRRLFRVEAGGVEVEDLGTKFEVENKGSSVRVSVSEGRVAVSFPNDEGGVRKRATLKAGESGVYPSGTAWADGGNVASSPANGVPSAAASAQPPEGGTTQAESATDWRDLARRGKYRQAYALVAPRDFKDVRNEAGDLLLASDVARLSQHPSQAARLLQELLASHESDARAPSAAFTLGWVLMNELGRPREAALAFARAETLAPRGNLAEDALARSVEAWYRAREFSRAKAEVERYRKTYPHGRHQAMLERLVMTP